MGHYFWGEDTYGARQAIEKLALSLKAKAQFLDRSDIDTQSLPERLAQGGASLFGATLLVVRDPATFPKSIQESFIEHKKLIGKSTCVLWDRGAPDKRSVFWKAFKPMAQAFPALDGAALQQWLQEQAKAMGVSLDDKAARELARRVGSDRWQLLQELTKLGVIDGPVTYERVASSVVSAIEEQNAFAMLDALVGGRAKVAMGMVEGMLQSGESEFRILALLAYQLRVLILIKQGLMERKSLAAIAEFQGLHSYVVEKNARVAERASLQVWLDMYARLLATDFSIKQGVIDQRTGLIMYVMSMSQALSGARV